MIPSIEPLPEAFRALRALVIGDAMLDTYFRGASRRLCQEAPVPIVDVLEKHDMPGGAGNCAANLAALGAKTVFLTAMGADAEGAKLCDLLKNGGVTIQEPVDFPARRTLAKTRILSEQQLIVRFDRGSTEPIDADIEKSLLSKMESLYPEMDAVVISDYGSGVLTPAVIDRLIALQKKYAKVLAIDSKNLSAYRFAGMTACKPNYRETTALLEVEGPTNGQRVPWLMDQGPRILELTGSRIAAVTLDSDGAVLFENGRKPYRTFARTVPSYRAAGAGDTFLCALALSLAAGSSAAFAAELASTAASLAVSKEYTATCTLEELLRQESGEIHPGEQLENLARIVAEHRSHNRRIVLTNGCFDILHRGHIAYLEQARRLGDVLIVGVNTDDGIRRLKGEGRPINQLRDRIEVLRALSSVDHVVAFDEDMPHRLIEIVQPDIFVKGGDYTREKLPEAALVERLGGAVKILPFISQQSTTSIIKRICRLQERQHRGGPLGTNNRKERIQHAFPMGNGQANTLRQA
jgi:D-beta-D-heptose 7-phosphate kinase/D-beta-D-heptose 1-phosphate adenosyltransferase